MIKKLTFILNVRFPTEKAYGVTTEFTLRAIEDTKTCLVTVITPLFDKSLESNLNILEKKLPFARIYNHLIRVLPNIGALLFTVWKIAYPFKLLFTTSKRNNLIWTRDIFTSLVFSMAGFQTLCEIHRSPSKLDSFFLYILKKIPKCKFATITIFLRDKLHINPERCLILPMAVNKFEIVKKSYDIKKKQFVVGYVGLSSSSGRSLSLDCVYNAALYFSKEDINVVFQLIGIEKKNFNQVTLPKNLNLMGRIPRDIALSKMDEFDIGLLLYPEAKYFLDSFPIKIVEYAARGVPILASDTTSHRNILGEARACYFDFNSDSSLIHSIISLRDNNDLREALSNSVSLWVRDFTYQQRARTVLDFDTLWNTSR